MLGSISHVGVCAQTLLQLGGFLAAIVLLERLVVQRPGAV